MKTFLAGCAFALAAPVSAQTVVAATGDTVPVAGASPLATQIAGKLFPDGTYRRMLGPQFGKMMAGMTDNIGTMPIGPLVKAAGLDDASAAKLDKASIGEIMAIIDPAFKERMRRTMDGMFAAMIPLFEKMEPDLRDGLALSLQSRFTPDQLSELGRFFATPTGNAFAGQQMLLFMDPAVMGKMQAQMPKIMEAMPSLIAEATKATADLPKAKTLKDLTAEERTKLAGLLGVTPEKLKK